MYEIDNPYMDYFVPGGYFKDVTALDYVELPDYKNATVDRKRIDSALEEVTAFLKPQNRVTDRAAVFGDTLNIDYVGEVPGEDIPGLTTNGAGTEVIIGKTVYVDDFIEQLIGHKPGETFDVNVTFPSNYFADLANKQAIFKTTINYIIEYEDVELTDELVAQNFSAQLGINTVSELEEYIEREILIADLREKTTVKSIPDEILNYVKDYNLNQSRETAESYGIEYEDYLTAYGYVFVCLHQIIRGT